MSQALGRDGMMSSLGGHPKGLAYLSFTELWERISYYGMSSLLVLYMVQQVLLPGHAENVLGMSGFRSVLESIFGPLSTPALASQIFGLYAGFVYFTPIFGGLIADRLLGNRKTILLGALVMSAGHFAMALDQSFLVALLLLIVGSGLLKGNISAQVGQLYPKGDETRRANGFTIFSMAINFGTVFGPLLCGLLAQLYGWHAGFGVAGVLMLLATVIYTAGRSHLPKEQPRGRKRSAVSVPPLTQGERRVVLLLFVAMLLTIFQGVVQFQFLGIALVWINTYVDRATWFGTFPTPWFIAVQGVFDIICAPPLVMLWSWQARRGTEPSEIGKIGIGAAVATLCSSFLALSALLAGDGKISPALPLFSYALMGVAFLYYWPPLLTLVSRAASTKVNATMLGAAYLALFSGNLIGGWFGRFYVQMPPHRFWLLAAAVSATGSLIILAVRKPLAAVIDTRAQARPADAVRGLPSGVSPSLGSFADP